MSLSLYLGAYLEQRTFTGLCRGQGVADAGWLLRQDGAQVVLTAANAIQTRHVHGEGGLLLKVHLHHQIHGKILTIEKIHEFRI